MIRSSLATQLRCAAAGADRRRSPMPGRDPRYADVARGICPLTECLKDTVARFLPYWHDDIVPTIKVGKRVIIAAHGNSLRALVKHLDDIWTTRLSS